MASHPGEIFVGRRVEMERLTGALSDTFSGRGRLVMLVGEPGIGKTRTAQELTALAQQRGAQVYWGWCYEQQGAPPYWPWLQPIRSYIQDRTPQDLLSILGPGAGDIAEMVPELLLKLPGIQPPPPLEPEQARFRLFDSITAFLKRAAQAQPLVLVLDDLHWADQPSLMLLEFLARQMQDSPLMLLGCYRDTELSRRHPLSETLARLSREPVFQRQPLRGLSHEDTGRFIESATGGQPPRDLLDAVFDHTEGNPFFTSEVVRLLSERGELGGARMLAIQEIRIPEGVREVIGQRLNRLSHLCNETLTVASVIGREFPFRLLVRLGEERTEAELFEAVDEAVGAHLIEELPNATDTYRFSHALVQQTLSDELTTSRRVRLHGRIGEKLEEHYGAETAVHAVELAHHFAEAEAALGPGKMVQYSQLAGDRALAIYAPEEALIHFQRALAVKEEQAMDSETAALLFGLGRAQSATLERHLITAAVASMSRAFDHYVKIGDVDRAVMMVSYLPLPTLTGSLTSMASLIEQALELVPADSHQAGRLLSRHGRELGRVSGDYEAAQSAFSRALIIARREGDVALEMRTLVDSALVDFVKTSFQEALEKNIKALSLAPSVNDTNAEMEAHRSASLSFRNIGNPESARYHAKASLVLAERLQNRGWLSLVLAANATISQMTGDWATAREYSDRGLEGSLQDVTLLVSRVLLEYEVGDFQCGEALLDRLVEAMGLAEPGPTPQYSYPSVAIPLAARITGAADRFDVAAAAAWTVLSSPSASPLFTTIARSSLALIAVQQGDLDSSREQYQALSPQKGTILTAVLTSVDRLLGLLSTTMGNLEQAASHFEDALAFCRKAGYRPELAWTCHDYAEALLAGAQHAVPPTPHRVKAVALLDESLAIAIELGMRPLIERVTRLKDTLGTRPDTRPAYPDGITQREAEVLRLIAAGKTDREIAEELIISINTVGNHVRSILNKTNAANRTEAATYAALRGLTVAAGDTTNLI